MIENNDINDFIALFNINKVRYLLVGGYAVILYSEPRYTKDIDFFIEPWNFFKLGRPPWRIDLITSLAGVDFSEIYKNSEETTLGRNNVRVVSKSDLIKIKTLAGRPQDLLDLEKLKD